MFNFKKIGIAVDNTDMDKFIYKACMQLDHELFDIQEIHIIHTKNRSIIEKKVLENNAEIQNLDNQFSLELKQEISKAANKVFGTAYKDRVHVHILDGSSVDEVIIFQSKTPMDIFLAGKKKEVKKSGRFAKELIRRLTIPVMMIPEEVPSDWNLKSIVVPYDYSAFSDKALESALFLKKVHPDLVIECLHLIESPAFSSGSIVSSQKIVRYMEEDRRMEFRERLNELKIDEKLELFIQVYDRFAGKEIQKHAYKGKFSLMIMGAKGHSSIERFFIGSVTEKVISLNDKIPLLIVR